MKLPDYFLADLPSEATLTVTMLREACHTLKRNRECFLASRSVHSLITVLSGVATSWLRPDYPLRKLALAQGPGATGFSSATLASGLDAYFRQLTPSAFEALLDQDLGHRQRLDQLWATEAEEKTSRAAVATAPQFLAHIAAGKLPNPTLTSLILGLLLRAAQFIKCPSGASFLPRLFAHSLYETDPKLGACLEIAEWPGGNEELEKVLFEEADCVTASGSDETLAKIRKRIPAKTRFVSYGHRVSFSYVSSEVLSAATQHAVVAMAAADVVAWDQLGCLSPHVIYVQDGGSLGPEPFADVLARELELCEQAEPREQLPPPEAAAIASRRSIYEVRAAHSPETRLWCSKGSTAWTVVYEADARFQLSCLNRFIYVKSVKDLSQALQSADVVRGKVSTVGVAASDDQLPHLIIELARWGVTRVCPLGRMQVPPLTWRHDGRPPLGELVTWTDWERS